ncbi:MAG: YHYH protein [Verrucomicrobiales bacterium]|nr:YHYH protein [Verrucomicrobiales bacterium]
MSKTTGSGHRLKRVEAGLKEWGIVPLAMLFSVVVIPVTVAAVSPGLAPYTAAFPGEHTLENPGGEIPKLVKAFAPFQETLGISWDEEFLYVEGNGLPDHPMMAGITAWQQQVPIPHDFTGEHRFKLPLQPEYLEEPGELTLMGPIALAVNGIPIFHALTQSGKDAYAEGELDQWGGHCGRADDYHYHIAPAHLESFVGKGNPVAFGLDGYPVYLADPSRDKPLDECHGYFDEEGNYRYVGELKPPYVMSFFRGQADLEDRPPTLGVRPHLQPLRGAEITAFEGSLADGYKLTYEVNGREGVIAYRSQSSGGVEFTFTDPDGTVRRESHERRPERGARPPRPEEGGVKGGKKERRDPR